MKLSLSSPKILVLGVLAGAYRGRQNDRQMVTHAVFDGHPWPRPRAFCGFNSDSLGDLAERDGVLPTCPACLKKMLKYVENSLAGKPTRFAKGAEPRDS